MRERWKNLFSVHVQMKKDFVFYSHCTLHPIDQMVADLCEHTFNTSAFQYAFLTASDVLSHECEKTMSFGDDKSNWNGKIDWYLAGAA